MKYHTVLAHVGEFYLCIGIIVVFKVRWFGVLIKKRQRGREERETHLD